MKIRCEVIKDLLPLYHDGVCSNNSKLLVEEHLAECELCRSEMEKIKNDTLDRRIQIERDDVVGHHAQAVKKRSLTAAITVSSILTVPILVCLIVNLATGHALDWFFIVLTGIMTLASVTVVPLLMAEHKGLWTLGSFTGSLTLLLLTCCLYSGGDWFFVAVVPIILGLCVLFGPFVVQSLPLSGFAARNKGLLVLAADSILLYGIIIVSGLYGGFGGWYWHDGLLITTVCLLLPWVLFGIIRYVKLNGFMRAGICTIIGGVFVSFLDDVIGWITNDNQNNSMLTDANFHFWNQSTLDANIKLTMLITGLIVGGVLLAIGVVMRKKK